MHALAWIPVVLLAVGLAGCVSLDPALVRELAKDNASVCVTFDARGGAGGIVGGATGGYGSSSLFLCRSQMPEARITISPDGSISIEHGSRP